MIEWMNESFIFVGVFFVAVVVWLFLIYERLLLSFSFSSCVCLFVCKCDLWVSEKKIHFIHSLSDDYNADDGFFSVNFLNAFIIISRFSLWKKKIFRIKVGGDMRPYFFFVEVDLKIDQSSSIWWWYLILITNNKLLTNDRIIIFFPREKWPEYYCLWLVADNFFK